MNNKIPCKYGLRKFLLHIVTPFFRYGSYISINGTAFQPDPGFAEFAVNFGNICKKILIP